MSLSLQKPVSLGLFLQGFDDSKVVPSKLYPHLHSNSLSNSLSLLVAVIPDLSSKKRTAIEYRRLPSFLG